MISGVLAGVSGILLADLQRLSGIALTFAVIPAIAAAVIGRFSSLPATVAGGLVIGVCEALLTPCRSWRPIAPPRHSYSRSRRCCGCSAGQHTSIDETA